ncbi:conserved hypothetical protein [Candidatus Protochlamydia naegleriophila]|uniref:SnoaL-like domain-containing protein n=1 Tax=Candidatus Protochlamydia naegleriophila TaxID=389348 RepID=A0A0U5JAK2_9BACT|nr:nuclear transport factor 2 family protein [Candidatus Protochlamydia naegleriophila]CUI16109.1 conserved hypothetical protein [Candidatus Protochlamydia naegleriophila]
MFRGNHVDEKTDLAVYIETALKEVIENMEAGEEVFSHYFSPSYTQHVDGHVLDYKDFIQHMTIQKTLLKSATVTIQHSLAEPDKVCTVHRVSAVKKNGSVVEIQVIAYFELENGKIVLCKELTHLISGADADRTIGSIK